MSLADVFAGYDAKREQLRAWAQRHYIDEFGLTGSLLDAGCGNGFWTALFADAGLRASGFDKDAALVGEAIRRHPQLRFEVADVMGGLQGFVTFDTVFARTLPQFYAPTLGDLTYLTANLIRLGKRLLLSAYTDGSRENRPTLAAGTARHHPPADLVAAVDRVARVDRWTRVGNYVQIIAGPRWTAR